MLLEFKVKNYKSFVDELTYSMKPAPKQKGLEYSILNKKADNKVHKGLCSSVIYGPNASGKTNLIGSMEVFKSIILRGNIRNNERKTSPNIAVDKLELIPSVCVNGKNPVSFGIKFIENNLLVHYNLVAELGEFSEVEYQRRILSETLEVNEKLIFTRKRSNLECGELSYLKDLLIEGFKMNETSIIQLAGNNLDDEELFLMHGFKSMFSSKLTEVIRKWLEQKFIFFLRSDKIESYNNFENAKKDTLYLEKFQSAMSVFGVSGSDLGYVIDREDAIPKKVSIVREKNVVLPAELFESFGTLRFMNIFPCIVNAIATGGVLVMDEFDSSLHPMVVMSIVNAFHNDEVNKQGAQLIFNTHNPIFLNSNLFRRDEIKFVDRDEITQKSEHYSLSDFGTSGKNRVNKHGDYMKNYFVSRFGAIKSVDFTDILKEMTNFSTGSVKNDSEET